MDFLREADQKLLWLATFVAFYWAYCVYWGVRGARSSKTATDYFLAGRGIGIWVFVLAATATSFSGWTFIGHPGLIYRDGLQYAYASFYAITIPFTGVLFLKRQWILGKHYGFVTPGEMFSEYFSGRAIRLLVVLVALCFSVPYLGIQLRASGFLFNVLSDGWLPVNAGMILLSLVVFIYVASGGLRAVAYVDTLQCILLAGGIIVIGMITLNAIGGFEKLNQGIAALAQIDQKRTPENYSHYIAIPGVIQFVSSGPSAVGGAWTGLMILTYMFALMGIQSAPAFSMWAFSNKSPAPFAPQQVWASSLVIGFILFFFTAIQGIGAHFLGADLKMLEARPDLVNNVLGEALGGNDLMEIGGKQGNLVPYLINLVGQASPWLLGLLAVCALAAMQSTGAGYMSTMSAMFTRDVVKHFFLPEATHREQKLWGRFFVAVIVIAALMVAVFSKDALVLLGGLAVAFGFQMWPALVAVCFLPWLTRTAISIGLIFGLLGVIATEKLGLSLSSYMGFTLPWGRHPLTMHSAFWGMLLNFTCVVCISFFTQKKKDHSHKMKFHLFLREHASLPVEKRGLIPLGWIIALVWFFFAVGPGAVIGNTFFGDPNDALSWVFGIPSIWAWQILWWGLGVFMMWFLAFKLELSTVPEKEVNVLTADIGDSDNQKASRSVERAASPAE